MELNWEAPCSSKGDGLRGSSRNPLALTYFYHDFPWYYHLPAPWSDIHQQTGIRLMHTMFGCYCTFGSFSCTETLKGTLLVYSLSVKQYKLAICLLIAMNSLAVLRVSVDVPKKSSRRMFLAVRLVLRIVASRCRDGWCPTTRGPTQSIRLIMQEHHNRPHSLLFQTNRLLRL